jgi:DNA-binding transcriptional ArsR family regulator
MKPTENENGLISQVRQVRALAAPTRQEILDTLELVGPATVAVIGAALGRAPDSLYYHIRILLGVGLVQAAENGSDHGSRELVYGLPSREMSVGYDLKNKALTSAVNRVVLSMSRIAYRDFEAAANDGQAEVQGPRRNLRGSRIKGALDARQLEEMNCLYERMVEIMSAPPRDPENATLHAVTFLMSPLRPSDRAAKTRSPRTESRRQ